MSKKHISNDLQYNIKEYIHYYLNSTNHTNSEYEEKVINMLSIPLKQRLQLESNKIVLKDSLIFKENFSQNILMKTIPLIQERRCTPGGNLQVDLSSAPPPSSLVFHR